MPETNNSEILIGRLAEGLDAISKMTQVLLADLRESEADFAAMKTELSILKENVKSLSEVIRDGGTSSILTRVALIEQNIENIKQWIDNHVDVHIRMKKDFSEVRNQLSELENRLTSVEKTLRQIESDTKEQERARRVSIDRELDFVHEKKKNDDKVRSEWHSTFVKIVGAITIGILGLIGGYLANSCTEAAGQPDPSAVAPAITQSPVQASSASAEKPQTP